MAYGTLYGAGFNSGLPTYSQEPIKKNPLPNFQSNLNKPTALPITSFQSAVKPQALPIQPLQPQTMIPATLAFQPQTMTPATPATRPTQPATKPTALPIQPTPTQSQRKNLDYWSFNAPPTSADRRFWYTPKSRGGGEFWRQQISNISTRNPYFVDPNQFNNPVNGMVQIAYDPIYPGSTGEIWVPLYVAQKLVSSTQPVISQPNPYENTNITTNTNPTIFA